tara:strand:+ start:1455 stop:1865 length:411 start_codon:yes stop_codon:yes gene_type:complete
MSHFSTIKTKIKEKDQLIEALELMGERPNVPFAGMSIVELVITDPDHAEDHPTKEVDIAIGVDIGFKWNETNETFEFIADRQTWSKNIPIERFLDKVTQQYARMIIHDTIKSEGFEVEDEYEMDDNTIELTVNRWV